jgi:metal-responsive CopG/Arc/MetJ family transcriptional regulator
LRLFRTSPPDRHTAFRLPKELLATIDAICDAQDLTRSQFFRRCLTERVKSLCQELDVQTSSEVQTSSNVQAPSNLQTVSNVEAASNAKIESNVQAPKSDGKRQWSPELYERLQRRR